MFVVQIFWKSSTRLSPSFLSRDSIDVSSTELQLGQGSARSRLDSSHRRRSHPPSRTRGDRSAQRFPQSFAAPTCAGETTPSETESSSSQSYEARTFTSSVRGLAGRPSPKSTSTSYSGYTASKRRRRQSAKLTKRARYVRNCARSCVDSSSAFDRSTLDGCGRQNLQISRFPRQYVQYSARCVALRTRSNRLEPLVAFLMFALSQTNNITM
jgi:hypothetical protein